MTETPDRTESIFAAAVALATAAERAAYLDQACAGDAALRGHVEALLRAHDRAGHLLDRPVPGGPEQTRADIPASNPAPSSPAATSCSKRSAKGAWARSGWPSRRSRSAARWP